MATNNKREKAPAKTTVGQSCPLRVKQATRRKLQRILDAVNKKDFGKRVRPDAVIDAALSLVSAAEIERLQQLSMSNADRLEAAYRRYAAKRGSTTKDEFLGLLLAGKVDVILGPIGTGDQSGMSGSSPQIADPTARAEADPGCRAVENELLMEAESVDRKTRRSPTMVPT